MRNVEKDEIKEQVNVISTVVANCQDCYRCVRACPVKAIRVFNGQARIDDDLCIRCGTCVKECPQHAKVIMSSVERVKELIASNRKVAASIAPSFAAVFSGWKSLRLPSALRRLGFAYISETAEGAQLVSQKSMEFVSKNSICTACPVVVNYVEKYHPEYVDSLIPVVSPMIAHARLIKKRLGEEWAVVFIGPCAAKKQEAMRSEYADAVDEVLTFTELANWLKEENIDLSTCLESGFENEGNFDTARLFPLQGGLLKTCNLDYGNTNRDIIHVSGPTDVMALFDGENVDFKLTEPLFCNSGCINGPGFLKDKNLITKRQSVITYAQELKSDKDDKVEEDVDLTAKFRNDVGIIEEEIDESKIQQVLDSTGKSTPELQLNCGACGYNSCRDKAIAVVKGMAEREMCMPYMRRLAQQRTDKIIETSPNAVVILDSDLNMIHMNPAFQKMFMCSNGVLGRRISYLINEEGFEKLASGKVELYESIKNKYGIRYHEMLYALREEGQYVGMFTDISKIKLDSSQIDLIKKQTLEHARELLNHQIKFSQEMAHFLGRNTGQSEELVKRIMDLYEEQDI